MHIDNIITIHIIYINKMNIRDESKHVMKNSTKPT